MNIKNIFTDEDAVSPVIGVILMVAITVILAAVIGAFVLGIGGSQEQTPQASWGWEDASVTTTDGGGDTSDITAVSLQHDGGEAVSAGELSVTVNGNPAFGFDGGTGTNNGADILFSGSSDVTAGSSVTVAFYDTSGGISDGDNIDNDGAGDLTTTGATSISSDDTVRLIWSSSESDSTQVLAEYTV
jgi:flagellin-like protein